VCSSDLARVVEGISRSDQKNFRDNPVDILKLWSHEMKRTFMDRMISDEDMTVF
jgi:hypothetical protein